ncbi:MAG: hypothetical protein KC550_04515, partial [Nanoarchaeota archaeon]|nr:hypothetical protein [Nanoarchaeota archaeon]
AFLISNVNNIDTTKTDSKVAELMNKVSEGDISTINDITKKLNSNDKNIFLEKLASGASSDYKNKLDNYKSGKNIDDMDKKELNFFIANVKLEKDDVKVYVNSLEMKSEDLAKYESGQNCNTEDDCKERIKEVKAEISNIENVLSGAKYDANALLLTLSPSEREAFLKNRKDAEHSSGWLGKIGSFFDFRSQQDIAVGIYLKSISDERDNLNNELFKVSGKFKTYNTEGAEDAVNTYNQNLISKAVAGSSLDGKCGVDFNECLGQVRDRIATCGENEDCKADLRLVAARLEAGSEYEMIESGWTQSIISSILSPKASDMKAARFFGFEEDYTDVPTFLKESFPSQMCMGKIEGYLDKTETESGGLTKYGCDNEDYVSKYDEQTKKFEQVGNPNCIKVMVDLRAQRTQITPDEEVAISYSYFLRAPSGVDLRVILALTYMDNGVRKKDLLTEDIIKLTGGETKKGFDSVDFKINSSDISKVLDTSDSFYLGLLALDSSNRPVYSESVPIALITGGDSYSFDVFTPTGSGSESGTSQGSVANKELSASDMLDLI